MSYSHTANISELSTQPGLDTADMYDYSGNDPYTIVEQYFQFCQTNLSENSADYTIQPARIYIRKQMEVNAAAAKVDDYYVIRVNFGTIVIMFRLFTDQRHIFEKEILKEFHDLHEHLDASLDNLLFQVSIQFTYYHERAHLIQKSPQHDTWLQEHNELDQPENEPFNLQRHLYEFDADLHASTFISFHLVDYWKKQTEKIRTVENLNLIASIGVASFISYFSFLMGKYTAVYFKASTHPHPLVRLSYIADCMVKTIEGNIGHANILNSNEVVQRAYKITNELFSAESSKWIQEFAPLFFQYQNEIKDFVDNVLIEEAKKLPELTVNR